MAKSNNSTQQKQKKVTWYKMPVNLMDDERVAELMAQKGVTGFGVYVCIICEMYRRQSRCLTMTQIKAIKYTGATQKTIQAVVNDFGLFRKDSMGHVYSVIDYLGFSDEVNNNDDDNDHDVAIESESPLSPTPARVYIDKDIDQDKDNNNHDDADFIAQIPKDTQWTQVTLMNSGFGDLIERNWEFALNVFHKHTIANCTIEKIRNVNDAKKYFHFYVTNPTSGTMLRKALEDHERLYPQQNPYNQEDSESRPGHRSYNGIPLPDDAPPRPDGRADWDFELNRWISPTITNQDKTNNYA